jgi:uncharacterized protein
MKLIVILFLTIFIGCNSSNSENRVDVQLSNTENIDTLKLSKPIKCLMRNLKYQTTITKSYDAAYYSMSYPNGDIDLSKGVCTDVVIRAMRTIGIDLQKLVHEDMNAHFNDYPALWNLKKTDSNIDHRRVQNLDKFFSNKKKSLKVIADSKDYLPGDIVAWKLSNGLVHVGMVYCSKNDGIPMMVHNIGEGAKIENVLFSWKIIGHYRWFN